MHDTSCTYTDYTYICSKSTLFYSIRGENCSSSILFRWYSARHTVIAHHSNVFIWREKKWECEKTNTIFRYLPIHVIIIICVYHHHCCLAESFISEASDQREKEVERSIWSLLFIRLSDFLLYVFIIIIITDTITRIRIHSLIYYYHYLLNICIHWLEIESYSRMTRSNDWFCL